MKVAEMNEDLPALTTQTKLDNHAIRDVKVEARFTVKYIFDARIAKGLSIPYAVAVDGVAQEIYKNKPKRVSGDNGQIVIPSLKSGASVALYLNSDAHPSYRKNPVYVVKVGERNVVVKVLEKSGKSDATDAPVLNDQKNNEDIRTDVYEAPLTGDIWMKISHKYTAAEVAALLPRDTSPEILEAIEAIYNGLASPRLRLDAEGKSLTINFEDSDNPRANIKKGYSLLSEGLTRVHPAGYAALMIAALNANVDKIAVTSCWRPMLGSIAHRAGLGLDINYLDDIRLNREELRKKWGIDTPNVSEAEKSLFAEFRQAKTEQAAARQQLAKAAKASKNHPDNSAALEALTTARELAAKADVRLNLAEAAWNEERNKNEPSKVRAFRKSLMKSPAVSQIFDPWFMDTNSKDKNAPVANLQISRDEKTHAHHFHITVLEPKIL
ncbi:hypothetical protein MKD49_08770 [Herbaspirillum sp. WGmk3]|uniref:hypothetical protein n=1 Tax=Herbaspirillum sp. WGmk3 TaxID=2919925 RepID=UPI0020900E33|nr:hypothetical protein [Herbaspirillum sp. WGmk3]MCO4856572.1 hypothetical protein [Herbaspirillum sp. WGmk3]